MISTERTMDPLARRPETWKLEQWLKDNKYPVGEVRTVFDLGSRDCIEAVELTRIFPNAKVVALECNPACVEFCRKTINDMAKDPLLEKRQWRLSLVDKAVNSWSGRCRFLAIDPDKTNSPWIDGNLGASSLLRANGDYPYETYAQREILVDCITLEDLFIRENAQYKTVIFADLQGAELLALKSGENFLHNVDLIYSEVSYRAAYEGQCMADELNDWLYQRGFRLEMAPQNVTADMWQSDHIWRAE